MWAYLAAFSVGLIELNIRAQNKCGFIIAPNKVPAVFFFIFVYDAQGKPGMVAYNDADYFYVYNLQGDVVALIDANDTQVVEYVYNAWGYPISKTGSLAATIGTLNPFRYRGYVYDEETGLYDLRSRYYNPVWKRFVNSDQHLGIVRGINPHNTYSYCFNSPCTMSDQSGQFALTAGLAATQSVVPEIGACS